jgi:uronate dehydrogenase
MASRACSCASAPACPSRWKTRNLATWLSYPDLVRLVLAALAAPDVGYGIVWGISPIRAAGGSGDDAHRIGFVPQDKAEDFADQVEPEAGDEVTRASRAALIAASATAGETE